jgi:hypothetical protein
MPSSILRVKSGGIVYCAVRCPWVYRSMQDCGGYVLEHRLVIAQYLGRTLKRNEYVRHKDGNTMNNEIGNLVLRRFR